jgi:hypothetical protein
MLTKKILKLNHLILVLTNLYLKQYQCITGEMSLSYRECKQCPAW